MDHLDKHRLRERFATARREMSPDEVREQSEAIRARLPMLPEFSAARTAYVYLSADNEVDTRGIVDDLLARGWRVVAPITRPEGLMHWGEVTGWDDLHEGRYGLFEPAEASSASHPTQGVALIPCVAFTAEGWRLGRGGGYYDRFLAQHEGPKIGLAFDVQRAEALPVETHDIPLDAVVTPRHVYRRPDEHKREEIL